MQSVFSRSDRKQYWGFFTLWILSNELFWFWWLKPENWGNHLLFWIMSIAFFYNATFLPSVYLFYVGNMKKPEDLTPDAAGSELGKVAVISLTVPGSESLEIVKRQLLAMKKISYSHDSWILVDKEHSDQIKKLALKHRVKYFCRHDVKKWGQKQVELWNQPIPPFQTKTKAGNVNAWIDAFGGLYSHFTQLDIDHIPNTDYLHQVLGHFSDPNVAWVQAPSVYGNFEHWTARGSAEQELVLQGPLQMGFYGFCETPFIIGSHCTYDMKSIKTIGGFQPTRAEDHLDTVYLAALGKKGVFLPKVIAIGDGPENFEMYLKQQFAWAYSMIQVLFNFTPKLMKNYRPEQALQFLFVQTWYPIWGVTMLLLFGLPIASLLLNIPLSHAGFWEFSLYSMPLGAVAFAIWLWSSKWHLPKGVGLTWRGVVLHIARWVVVLQAFIQVVFRVKKPYMITIKGLQKGGVRPFSIGALTPYLWLAGLSLASCWFYIYSYTTGPVQGYLLFALQGAAFLLLICLIALVVDIKQMTREDVKLPTAMMLRKMPLFLVLLAWFAWADTAAVSAHKISTAVFNPHLKQGLELISPEGRTIKKIVEEPTEKRESRYVVVEGDSLWGISKKAYGTGKYWILLSEVNGIGGKPIHPGQELELPVW